MGEKEGLQALTQFYQLMQYNGAVQSFKLANEYQLLHKLQAGSLSCERLAENCNLKAKPLQLLLNVLQTLTLLDEKDGQYSLTSTAQFFTASYNDLGQSYWEHLPKYLKTGEPCVDLSNTVESEQFYAQQVHSLYWLMQHAATIAAKNIAAQHTQKNIKVLDVGAGSGVWSFSLAKQLAQADLTLNDWPQVLKVTEDIAKLNDSYNSINYLAGDFHSVEITNSSFDIILIGNVIHLEDEAGLEKILTRLRNALTDNGRIYIIDTNPSQEKPLDGNINYDPLAAALYELGLGIRTTSGKVHSPSEVELVVNKIGFSNFSVTQLDCIPEIMLMYSISK